MRRTAVIVVIGTVSAAGTARAGDELPPVQALAVGDFDGDGRPDVAAGLPEVNVGKLKKAGEVRIYSGAGGAFLRKLSGVIAEQAYGESIAAVGDVDGDGATDLAVTANSGESDPYIDIVSGKSGKRISMRSAPGPSAILWGDQVCALGDGSGKTRVDVLVRSFGEKQWQVHFTDKEGRGGTIADEGGFMSDAIPVGDVDGDGKHDVAICHWAADVDGKDSAGLVRVVSGGSLLRGGAGSVVLTVKGEHEGALIGIGVAAAGDWDGDGKGDVLVGNAGLDPKKDSWRARVLSGKDGSEMWKATGVAGQWHVPAVALVGDADGDGKPDVAVASGATSAEAGSVMVCAAKDGAVLWTVKGAAKENLGDEILPFPDLDADGVADVLVTAPRAALQGKKGNGSVRVLSGKTGTTLLTVNPLVAK